MAYLKDQTELLERVEHLYYDEDLSLSEVREVVNEEFGTDLSLSALQYAVRIYIDRPEKKRPGAKPKNGRRRSGNEESSTIDNPVDIPGINEDEVIQRDVDEATSARHLRQARREYKDLIEKISLNDEILNLLGDKLNEFPTVEPPPPFVRRQGSNRIVENAVLLVSDSHIGEFVDPERTGGLGSNSVDTFKRRLQYLAEKVIDILHGKLREGYVFPKIYIALLGDILSGTIHEELVETADMGISDCFLVGLQFFAQFLMDMCREFPEVEVLGVVGNHGRLSKKKKYKKLDENWDYVLYKTLEHNMARQENLSFRITKGPFIERRINGKNFIFTHGDTAIRSWAGMPWYGVVRGVTNLAEMLNSEGKIIDYVCMGHFHSPAVLDRMHGGEIILNGSMIGASEYAISTMYRSSHPKQWLFSVHEEKGKSFSYNIDLLNAEREIGTLRYR